MIVDRHYVRIGVFILFCLCGGVHAGAQQRGGAAYEGASLISYVNPLTGTAASATAEAARHGTGTEELANTLPSVTYPFGMTQWVPQTEFSETKCVAPYYYKDSLFSGFRGSHWISGSCMQDYGSVTVMAMTGHLQVQDARTPFSHSGETATPALYRVNLPAYHLSAAVTATARCGFIRFTAHKTDSLYVLVRPNSDRGNATLTMDKTLGRLSGSNPVYRIYQGAGQPAGFSGYWVIQFRKGIREGGIVHTEAGSETIAYTGPIAFIGFALKAGESVDVKVGTSFSSEEGAARNLSAELPGWDFEGYVRAATERWNGCLSQVMIDDSAPEVKRIFYTALYHSMQQPRLYNDADGTYPAFASSYRNARLSQGNYYDDFSMWDIYRAQIPLMEILSPALVNDFVRSFVLKSEQGGWLPDFPCWNSYTSEMVGDHGNVLIASAYTRGIRGYDVEKAYGAMRKNAFEIPPAKDYADGRGRRSLASYLAYGYYPLEDTVPGAFHKNEQVSRTLEYAYDDYCAAQLAKGLHRQADYDTLLRRSGNYVNVFDTAIGFMNGRYATGAFYQQTDPDSRMFFITEGTPRQYTFYVPQDMPGLIRLLGGKAKLEAALDSLFSKDEYWHGNEPDQQVPFLYNYTDHPSRTGERVRQILTDEYSDGPGGLCGNDDAGQISAWYVFGALGLYPVNPASDRYALFTPLVREAAIHLPNGHIFRIVRRLHGDGSVRLNGKLYRDNFIGYADIMRGGTLEFER